jgi:hypothetical protein
VDDPLLAGGTDTLRALLADRCIVRTVRADRAPALATREVRGAVRVSVTNWHCLGIAHKSYNLPYGAI